MRSKLILLGVLAVLLMGITVAVGAQDETPAESPLDNACYAGGSMEGKCDWPTDAEDEWAWECGWYIAHYQNAEIGLRGIPIWCSSLSPVCYQFETSEMFDILLIAPVDTPENVLGYQSRDRSCSGKPVPMRLTIVIGTADFSLESIVAVGEKCEALTGYPAVALPMNFINPTFPPTWWICISEP